MAPADTLESRRASRARASIIERRQPGGHAVAPISPCLRKSANVRQLRRLQPLGRADWGTVPVCRNLPCGTCWQTCTAANPRLQMSCRGFPQAEVEDCRSQLFAPAADVLATCGRRDSAGSPGRAPSRSRHRPCSSGPRHQTRRLSFDRRPSLGCRWRTRRTASALPSSGRMERQVADDLGVEGADVDGD